MRSLAKHACAAIGGVPWLSVIGQALWTVTSCFLFVLVMAVNLLAILLLLGLLLI